MAKGRVTTTAVVLALVALFAGAPGASAASRLHIGWEPPNPESETWSETGPGGRTQFLTEIATAHCHVLYLSEEATGSARRLEVAAGGAPSGNCEEVFAFSGGAPVAWATTSGRVGVRMSQKPLLEEEGCAYYYGSFSGGFVAIPGPFEGSAATVVGKLDRRKAGSSSCSPTRTIGFHFAVRGAPGELGVARLVLYEPAPGP